MLPGDSKNVAWRKQACCREKARQLLVESKNSAWGMQDCCLENARMFNEVLAEISEIQEIIQCHYTTGQYSMFIKVYAKDNRHLKTVLSDKLLSINGISRTETFMSLEVLIDREIPIEL